MTQCEGLFASVEPRHDKHGRVHELFVLELDSQLFERLRQAWHSPAPVAGSALADPGSAITNPGSAWAIARPLASPGDSTPARTAVPDARTKRRIASCRSASPWNRPLSSH